MYNIEVYSITVCLCLKLFSCGGGATMIIITQFVPKMAKCPTTPISKRNMMKHCVLSSFQARNLHLEWFVHLFPIFSILWAGACMENASSAEARSCVNSSP